MKPKARISHFYFTEVGPRIENQDYFKVQSESDFSIFTVADGVGGRSCGSLASKFCVENLHDLVIVGTDYLNAIHKVNQLLISKQKERTECQSMATTLTSCKIRSHSLEGGHVGDSRLCVLRGNGIRQLNVEHSEAARLMRAGLINIEQYHNYPRKNIIESAVGIVDGFTVNTFNFALQSKDRIIISTDGFHDIVKKKEIRDISLKFRNFDHFAAGLCDALMSKKLKDNATFIAIEII